MIRLGSRSFLALAFVLAACGGGSDQPDALITFYDAPPPDGPPPPDAWECVESETIKECGPGMAGCVDITESPDHCGACDQPCPAGAACVDGPGPVDGGETDLAHCECPAADWVPTTITGLDTTPFGIEPVNSIPQLPGAYLGLGPFLDGSLIHAVVLAFALDDGDAGTLGTPIGQDIDLATVTGFVPSVAMGYNIDIDTQQFQGAYRAVSGTLNLDYACTSGAGGTVTNAHFIAVEDITNPVPVEGGCSFDASFTFTLGTACN